MLDKNWKKVLMIILIVACLINIIIKLVKVVSFDTTIDKLKSKVQVTQKENTVNVAN